MKRSVRRIAAEQNSFQGSDDIMRILLVEDDLNLAQFIRKGLKEEQYAVDFAADGEEGLELALGNPYDLLILDIMLPKLDGLTLCRRVRAKGNVTPVLLLTARNTVEAKVSGYDTGADQFLPKPFAFAELLARIRALLRRGGPQQLVHLKAADLELDPASHRVWRAGQEIPLTNKEYALLEFLLRNKNRVLTRTAIIEHVWDISYDPMTNIVDAHIRALRAKIDRDFSPPLMPRYAALGTCWRSRNGRMKSLRSLIRQSALILDGRTPPGLFCSDLHRGRRLVAPLCGWPAVSVGGDAGQDR